MLNLVMIAVCQSYNELYFGDAIFSQSGMIDSY